MLSFCVSPRCSDAPRAFVVYGAAGPFLFAMRLDVLVLAASGCAPNPSFI